jgi:translation initiation factor 1
MADDNSRLVYSTGKGRVRPPSGGSGKPSKHAAGPGPAVPDDGIVRLHRGKAGKGGKAATLVTGLPGSEADLDAILKQLKQALGAGGSRDGRVLAIQGDQREKLRERLEQLGHRVKLAGG